MSIYNSLLRRLILPVNFNSEEFLSLSRRDKKEVVVNEFKNCSRSFKFYLDNYAKIRHPNAGVIRMKAFDYQLDAAIPISTPLLHSRSEKSVKEILKYKDKFDYKKWWKQTCEKNIELSKVIPAEFHNFHKITAKDPDIRSRVDTIIVKSRQTGLSTIFEQLSLWHINFHASAYDLVVSQRDTEAKKFVGDIISSYELLEYPLRAKRLNSNEHELSLSLAGHRGYKSVIQAFPPTVGAGRSYSPNLIILDEFAMYGKKAAPVWTAISMSVAAGGIIVIISTPKGVGNLFHKMWEAVNTTAYVDFGTKTSEDEVLEQNAQVFRPMAVHWSQLPQSEFERRGFRDGLAWYKHMKAKIMMEKDERVAAQELDLSFLASGSTIDVEVVIRLLKNCMESNAMFTVLKGKLRGLTIYEKPQKKNEYVIGVDAAEGRGGHLSAFHVLKVVVAGKAIVPKVVAKYASNTVSLKQYKDIIKRSGFLYNTAWLNIERNNHGHVLLTYLIEEDEYPLSKIINRYDPNKMVFMKDVKGWHTGAIARGIMLTALFDHVTEIKDLRIPKDTAEEFKTFVEENSRWAAQEGYDDDHIISLSLGMIAARLLPKYKQWLIDNDEALNDVVTDIPYGDVFRNSSQVASLEKIAAEMQKSIEHTKKELQKTKQEVNLDELAEEFKFINKVELMKKRKKEGQPFNKFISRIVEEDDLDSYAAF